MVAVGDGGAVGATGVAISVGEGTGTDADATTAVEVGSDPDEPDEHAKSVAPINPNVMIKAGRVDRCINLRFVMAVNSIIWAIFMNLSTNAGKVVFGNQTRILDRCNNLNQIETPHIFAGNPIDRADALRRDESDIGDLMHSDQTQVLIMAGLDPFICVGEDGSASLGWIDYEAACELLDAEPSLTTFLGINSRGASLVAWNVGGSARNGADEITESSASKLGIQLCDARESAMMISGYETGILAQARANLGWHSTHQFCARCGNSTEMRRGGLMRQCVGCNAQHFPRTDPVVITVVTDGERCLLGQSAGRLSAMRMYSALAGFMDQGESMEEAVRREVKEEAGIEVGRVRYHSTQPWPFPSSLMIGSHAEALTTQIEIDDFEMTDVRWWDRDEVLLALAENSEQLRVPGPIAIAHHLIKAWASRLAGDFRTS